MSKSHLKIFICGSAVSLLGTVLLGIVNYLTRRFLCCSLSIADYGTFYSAFALLAMVFGICDLGLTQSGTMLIAAAGDDRKRRDGLFTCLFLFKGGSGLLCAAGITGYFQLRPDGLPLWFWGMFSGYFVCQTLNGTLQALWGGQKKYALQQFAYLFIACSTCLLVWRSNQLTLHKSVLFFLLPAAAALLLGVIYSRIAGHGSLQKKVEKNLACELCSTGGLVAIITTLLTVMYYMDTVMLNIQRGAESAGLYNIALPIMQIVQSAMVFPAVFLPIAVDMCKQREYRRLTVFVRTAVLLAMAALVPAWGFFHFCGRWLIEILFDSKYVQAAPAVTILCVGLIFFTLGNFLFQIMLSLKRIKVMAVIAVITAVCNLLLNYFLIKFWDFCGAAWATLISYLFFAGATCIALEYNLNRMRKL